MAIDLFTIGNFTVHGYGLMIGIGFILAVIIGGYRTRKLGLSDDHFTNIAICLLVFGFMGGKLLYLIVNFKLFLQDPLRHLGSEGFVVYGGIIVGIFLLLIIRMRSLSKSCPSELRPRPEDSCRPVIWQDVTMRASMLREMMNACS